jgi:hypothetical protein
MPLTAPPSAPPAAPDAPGAAPSRSDPSTFRSRADAFVLWQVGMRTAIASLRDWLATFITWAGTHVTEMNALQTDVATKQGQAATSATNAATSETNAAASATSAGASAGAASSSASSASASANSATLAAATNGAYPNGAATNVPRGLTQASVGTITGGSGGTAGTFALSWSGGNFSVNPTGTFTVSGGAVTAVTITGPGQYIGSSPTVPTPGFSASSGLTGASVALTAQFLVASGNGYWVQSADGKRLNLYRNSSGTAVLDTGVQPIVSASELDDSYHERLFAARGRAMDEKRQRWTQYARPRALVHIAVGQSNNAKYNAVVTTDLVSSDAYRPVGGTNVGDLQFYGANQEHTPHWSEFASAVTLNEFTTESTLSGAALLLQGLFPRTYSFSAAYGGNGILQIAGNGKRTSLFATVFRLCDMARAAGYEPVVAYSFVDGEANMAGFQQMDEATFKATARDYFNLLQRVAAMAMDKPDYDAPIVVHTLSQMSTAGYSKGINNALVALARETPNAILGSPILQWPVNGDLIHNTGPGFRKRSEQDGYLLYKFFSDGKVEKGIYLIDAVRTGSSLRLTFSQDVTIDTSIGLGTLVNAANAKYGIEYTYDGTAYVQVVSASVSNARTITCTLASDPGSHTGTEEVRIGCQLTNGGGGTWPQNAAGASIRSAVDPGFTSPYDGTTTYLYAASHYRAVR